MTAFFHTPPSAPELGRYFCVFAHNYQISAYGSCSKLTHFFYYHAHGFVVVLF